METTKTHSYSVLGVRSLVYSWYFCLPNSSVLQRSFWTSSNRRRGYPNILPWWTAADPAMRWVWSVSCACHWIPMWGRDMGGLDDTHLPLRWTSSQFCGLAKEIPKKRCVFQVGELLYLASGSKATQIPNPSNTLTQDFLPQKNRIWLNTGLRLLNGILQIKMLVYCV